MSDFITQYQEDKKVRDLAKRRVLKIKCLNEDWCYNNHDLTFKITHIKKDPEYNTCLIVNVNVSGAIKGYRYYGDDNVLSSISKRSNFRSTIQRNRLIRRFIGKKIEKEMSLFGVQSWMLSIGKLNIKESI
jgi:hypothetical protein|tara:strand:+ start:3552 stop:3944 length:393 start_codon:yes stop_codon:yes gene_type:complete